MRRRFLSVRKNHLRIRVYGTEASLEWHQEYPTDLWVRYNDQPARLYRMGNPYNSDIAKHFTRLPAGHPEAFIEAFANIYRSAARTMAAKIAGTEPHPFDTDFPTVIDGARGVHFIHKAVESARSNAKWLDVRYTPPA